MASPLHVDADTIKCTLYSRLTALLTKIHGLLLKTKYIERENLLLLVG